MSKSLWSYFGMSLIIIGADTTTTLQHNRLDILTRSPSQIKTVPFYHHVNINKFNLNTATASKYMKLLVLESSIPVDT